MRILVIEDNQVMAENICRFLASRGHEPDLARDGTRGLEMAVSGGYDAVVLDLMLPGLHGLELCHRLRQEARSHIPVLILTARDSLNDKLDGFAAGGDDYLSKPFSLFELEARLCALDRRSQGATEPAQVLRVADLEYDLGTQVVRRAGRTLKLRPTTRKILELLMRADQRVVTRSEIEAHVWGGSAPDADVVRVHMYAIRNAIDKPFPVKLLHNVYGTGYRLAPTEETTPDVPE